MWTLPYKISEALVFRENKTFFNSKTINKYDDLKPIQRDFKPESFVLHVETNDLPLNKSPEETSEEIITLGGTDENRNKIIASSIGYRAGSFSEKVEEVNARLEEMSQKTNSNNYSQ